MVKSIKIIPGEIINDTLAILTAVGILGAGYVIANRFFGFDSYNGLSSEHLSEVIAKLTDPDNYTIISHVQGKSIWGRDYVRGILMGKGGQLYYYRFTYENGQPTDIMIFPEYFETWSTTPNIFDTATLL